MSNNLERINNSLWLTTTTSPKQTVGITRRITPYHRFRRRLPCEKIRQKSTGKELDRETGLYYFGARYLCNEALRDMVVAVGKGASGALVKNILKEGFDVIDGKPNNNPVPQEVQNINLSVQME